MGLNRRPGRVLIGEQGALKTGFVDLDRRDRQGALKTSILGLDGREGRALIYGHGALKTVFMGLDRRMD